MEVNETVLFLGAGFSKACGLPTTREIEKGLLTLGPTRATPAPLQNTISEHLRVFWAAVFGHTSKKSPPALEDHFTVLDGAANSGHNLGSFDPRKLRAIRRLSIHRIFDILDQSFGPSRAARELVKAIDQGAGNTVITTNWDTAVERLLFDETRRYHYGLPTFELNGHSSLADGIRILKLHGSSNWMYCDSCRRVVVGNPGDGKTCLHSGVFLDASDFDLLNKELNGERPIVGRGEGRLHCRDCRIALSARVATFSFRKALGFFQFQAVWDVALRALIDAKAWLFIGYSLPQADFEIRSLLKTAETAGVGVGERRIVAVPGRNREAAKNYRRFFGTRATVFPTRLDDWWSENGGPFGSQA